MKKLFFLLILLNCFTFAYSNIFESKESLKMVYDESLPDGINESKMFYNKENFYVEWIGNEDKYKVYHDNEKVNKLEYISKDSHFILERKENKVFLIGEKENKKIEKEFILDDLPWFQIYGYSLSLIDYSSDNIYFWTFNPQDLDFKKMYVYFNSFENIRINNKDYNTMNIKMKIDGFLSTFWTGDFWIDSEDKIYLKYKGLNIYPKLYTTEIIFNRFE
ncbi:hypothetical protein [Oceanotoga teriensis]|uniref:hypothetical protein n=1 Tax=Oceanotoga teriensis TaxID=515440 RepID=UPI002712EAE5|nr:hypothetical protein [Oceanotoga teriensis]MDO7976178.1 hypothetical protein [Oceanotoga teriensis]